MIPLKRLLPPLALLLLWAGSLGAAEGEETVVVTRIEGQLSESMMATLERAIDRAVHEEAAALILEIDTPGGEIELMDRLGGLLATAEVQPIALVLNEAVSAGAFLAMSCELIFTMGNAQIGSATPIHISPVGIVPEGTNPDLEEKTLSYLRAKFRDRAQTHDRPGMEALAEAMVDRRVEVLLVDDGGDRRPMTRDEFDDLIRSRGAGAVRMIETICSNEDLLNLTAQEAFDYGFSDGIVLSRDELLESQGLDDARVIEILPSWSERMVGALEGIQWILLVAGLVLVYIEFKMPGFGIAGSLGLIFLSLLMFKNYLVGLAEIPEILLVLLGFVLLVVEIFVFPGFGAAGIAGITCISLGVIFSFLPFFLPDGPVEVSMLKETIQSFSISLAAVFISLMLFSKVLPRTPILNRLVLDSGSGPATLQGSAVGLAPEFDAVRDVAVGDAGTAASDLRPAGKVVVDGQPFDARSEGDWIARGERVLIVSSEGNHLVVRKSV